MIKKTLILLLALLFAVLSLATARIYDQESPSLYGLSDFWLYGVRHGGESGPVGINPVGGTDFSGMILQTWTTAGGTWVRPFTDNDLDDLPFELAYFVTLLQSSHTPISAYQEIDLIDLHSDGKKWLHSSNLQNAYSTNGSINNRNMLQELNLTGGAYRDFFFYYIFNVEANYWESCEDDAGGCWASLSTAWYPGPNSNAMMRLYSPPGANDGVYLALAVDDDITDLSSCTLHTGGTPFEVSSSQHQWLIVSTLQVPKAQDYKACLYLKGDTTAGIMKLWGGELGQDINMAVHLTGETDQGSPPEAINWLKVYGSWNGTPQTIRFKEIRVFVTCDVCGD